jgi:protein SCO1
MTRMSPLRRQVLRAGLALGLAAMYRAARADSGSEARDAARSSHFPFGPVVPARLIPGWPVVTHRGENTNLATLLHGRVTALQLMFAGCTATCPIQGALFGQAQRELGETTDVQLISLTIAPLADTPAVLTSWLRNFDAGPKWLGVSPRVEDLEQIFTVLTGGGEKRPAGPDPHTGQVYITNRRAELVYRTPSMPPAQQIVAVLRTVQKSDPPA